MRHVLIAVLITFAGLAVHSTGVLTIRTEEVRVRSGHVELAGLLAMPRFGTPPFPTIIAVHGSGRTTRAALRGFVAKFVPRGFAVLIHDKRGTGSSGGDKKGRIPVAHDDAELRLLARDVGAWVDLVARHPHVDGTRIGLIGGSQAGWIMPLVAAEHRELAFLVALSGPTVRLSEEDLFSRLTGDDPGGFAPGELDEREIRRQLDALDAPAGYDPTPALRALRVPSLWIFGGRDRSVPTRLCRARIASLPGEARSRMDVLWYPDADHDLCTADGVRVDYWTPLSNWILARVGG